MCMIDDAEPFDAWRNTTRKARKEHFCSECGRIIKKGETYYIEVGISRLDGISQSKTCTHCKAGGTWLETVCGGHCLGMVREELNGHWHEDSTYRSMWLGRVLVGMRRGWKLPSGERMAVPDPFTKEKAQTAGLA